MLELCSKLEIWHVSKHSYLVSENIPFSTKVLLILLISAFFGKISVFFGQNSTFTQSYQNSTFTQNFEKFFKCCVCIMREYLCWKFWRNQDLMCVITSRLVQNGHKLEKWQWRDNIPACWYRQIFLTLFNFSCQF